MKARKKMTMLYICFFGFISGVIDSIVGGGGLISIPVLMTTGMPTYMVLGTNKLASTMGTLSSAHHFIQKKEVDLKLLKKLLPFSLIGAAIGTTAVLKVNPEFLEYLIIFLVIVIGIYTFTKRDLGLMSNRNSISRRKLGIAILFTFVIGFYNGFFGPGTGSFIIFGLVWIFGFDFKEASANAKLLNLTGNFTALMLFIFGNEVNYYYGIPMAIAMMVGAKFGAHLAITRGARFVKPVFLIVTFSIVIKMSVDVFLGTV